MRAAGVNPADIKTRNGARRATVPVIFPMAVGREAAGTVVALGPGVAGLHVGEEVFGAVVEGHGTFGEFALLAGAATALRPAGVTPEQAACIPVAFGTAWDALNELALSDGATVLVLGAGGGVGLPTCRLAAGRGVRVLGLASPGKAALVEATGAQHVSSADDWVREVRALAPEGVDGVLDAVGGATLAAAAPLRRRGAPLRSIADVPGAEGVGGAGVTRRRTREVFAAVAAAISDGRFTPHLDRVLPVAEAADAVAVVEGGHAAGKVVVVWPEVEAASGGDATG